MNTGELDLNSPHLVVSDIAGNFMEVPELFMAAVGFVKPLSPEPEQLITLSQPNQLQVLPGRVAIGYDPELEKFVQIREYNGKAVFPVAADLSESHLQIHRSAFSMVLDAPRLPNQNYTAVGCKDGKYYVSAIDLNGMAQISETSYIVESLADINPENVPENIKSIPNFKIIFALDAPDMSLLGDAIRNFRSTFPGSHIQLNLPSIPKNALTDLCEAGLDSLQLTINSAQASFYEAFHKQAGYKLDGITSAFREMKSRGGAAILNYLVFPGLTDHPQEMTAFSQLLSQTKIDKVTLQNMEIDPEWYMDELAILTLERKQVGISNWLKHIREDFPQLLSNNGYNG